MSSKRKSKDPPSSTDNKKNKLSNDGDEGSRSNAKAGETTTTATKKGDFFKGLHFYILQPGIEKARLNIFKNQIVQNGGILEEKFSISSCLTHIIVEDKMEVDRMVRLLSLTDFPEATTVVKTMWLSKCLKNKALVETDEYQLRHEITLPAADQICDEMKCDQESEKYSNTNISPVPRENVTSSSKTNFRKAPNLYHGTVKDDDKVNDESDYEASDDDIKTGGMDSDSDPGMDCGPSKKNIPVDKWICAQSSKNPKPNQNKHITDKLEEMVKAYASTNDKWRSYGYQKCIRALMRHPTAISSWEEAKSLPGVGGRLADKIWEIAQSGELRKLNEFKSSEEIRTMELFNNVWGAGPHTSRIWLQLGFRSIEDLQTKAKLTSQQKVGVRLYDDLLERMPREEAGRIAEVVREAAESIQPGIIAQACGSYRRGKVTCGDVDVLITHPDGKSHKGIFGKLLDNLHQSGFLTDDLVSSEENGNQKKYLGVCKLPGDDTKHRRLDIITVPYHEYACAVVYFTGSAHFNRSLRLLCKRQDMSLSEHALRGGVIRQGGERVHEGTIIPTPTEESLFKVLKVPYRPPEERDH